MMHHSFHCHSLRTLLLAAAVAAFPAAVFGETESPATTSATASAPANPPPAAAATAETPAATTSATTAAPAPAAIPVAALKIAYGNSDGNQPLPLADLANISVTLIQRDGVWVPHTGPLPPPLPAHLPPPIPRPPTPVTFALGETFPSGARLSADALVAIFNAIIRHFNERGVQGVFVVVDSNDIDPRTHEDYRAGTRGDLRLVVWVARVTDLRTIARGDRFPTADSINNPAHRRIAAHSPVRPGDAASLLNKPALDAYLLRLNRHPSRRVDAAITSGAATGEVTLDYLAAEKRSWFAYAQVSNTGTKSTNRYRENIGAAFYQVTNADDTLQANVGSASVEYGNSASISYERPLVFPDYLRIRPFASYGDFTAKDIAYGLEDFKGSSAVAGLELLWSPVRLGQIAFDLAPGLTWQYYHVNNRSVAQKGDVNLLVPMLALRAERNTDTMRTAASITYEFNICEAFASGNSAKAIKALGHPSANLSHDILRYEFRHSMFLEPLLFGEEYHSGQSWHKSTRAHEIILTLRGQQALNSDPLIPQKKMTLGGLYTVRGYPESLVTGDAATVLSAEYRLHLPRLLRPYKTRDKDRHPAEEAAAPLYFGTPFNWRAPSPNSVPDWDAALCFFTDIGRTTTTRPYAWERRHHTLVGAGAGLEIQVGGFLNLRADYAFALNSVQTTAQRVHRNSSEFHFSATLLW